jgi:hypothetical protein
VSFDDWVSRRSGQDETRPWRRLGAKKSVNGVVAPPFLQATR